MPFCAKLLGVFNTLFALKMFAKRVVTKGICGAAEGLPSQNDQPLRCLPTPVSGDRSGNLSSGAILSASRWVAGTVSQSNSCRPSAAFADFNAFETLSTRQKKHTPTVFLACVSCTLWKPQLASACMHIYALHSVGRNPDLKGSQLLAEQKFHSRCKVTTLDRLKLAAIKLQLN